MEIESLKDSFKLVEYLGIEFVSVRKDDVVVAKMPVDDRNVQPFGTLCGGATLALAEIVAGAGSVALCNGGRCAGLNISCNHIHPAMKGDTVTATAQIVHKGAKTHVWQVDIYNQDGILISRISVTNFIME